MGGAPSEDAGRRPSQGSGQGPEFGRAVALSDSIFAFAMTLLVVTINLPRGVDDADLGQALSGLRPSIRSFFISFAVIGYLWIGHHRFFADLGRLPGPLLLLNMVYLATIAFAPFPTEVLGEHGRSAVAITLYAATIATITLLDAAMFVCAHLTDAFRAPLPPEVFRYGLVASLIPVAVFAASIPLSTVDTTVAQLSWLLILPAEKLIDHWKPAATDEFLHF